MPALDDTLQQKLRVLETKRRRRVLKETGRMDGVRVRRSGRELVSFSCNDYLGLSHRPEVTRAAKAALDMYGAGAGASRLVTGNYPLYDKLEAALAKCRGTAAACVFGSGYLANIGTIPALVGAGDLIIADKFIHACMVDGARLSGATVMRFAHNNLAHCRMLLEANRPEHHHCLLLTETVFSMDGDRAPVSDLAALAKEFDGWLMVDGAHDFPSPIGRGWRIAPGEGGAISDALTSAPLPGGEGVIQMGTLSKAAGSYGGYVCGSEALVEYLKNAARSLIYSTGLPPATVAASLAALEIMADEPELVKKPLENARMFTSLLGMKEAQSAIVPLVLKENDKALAAANLLEERGFLVSAIRPPTVPEHTARLRFAFSALHTTEQIEAVAKIVKEQGWLES
ncbi:MAG: 8-amino-7-oxononanoate synthase [Pseudomonadota bacterium]|nr:8-amino-7-oxononanoate synthase [Pseudomonadota bacterium]